MKRLYGCSEVLDLSESDVVDVPSLVSVGIIKLGRLACESPRNLRGNYTVLMSEGDRPFTANACDSEGQLLIVNAPLRRIAESRQRVFVHSTIGTFKNVCSIDGFQASLEDMWSMPLTSCLEMASSDRVEFQFQKAIIQYRLKNG